MATIAAERVSLKRIRLNSTEYKNSHMQAKEIIANEKSGVITLLKVATA